MSIQEKILGLSSAAQETMRCLFFHGPTQDGDVPSKSGRTELVEAGYAERWNGLQWLTRTGIEFAVNSMLLEGEKEKWQRERSRAVHAARHPRPDGSNADAWLLFLEDNKDSLPYAAVQIAVAIEDARR